ncbi:uncharacterized protein C2845_PM17G15020 [Panicum miliaceum]|uniref:DUF1618 domain-containing protein n=1 Tax=Panicum miliaceum TaxID=4540 RepID=A0A3L6Q2C9_PANMI|nr:uncharacterized protein C2845_PM17G15020 [Panicum miliaceum]
MEEPAPEPIVMKPSPRWIILDRFIHRSSRDADARGDGTASATSYTCTGGPIRASLRVAAAAVFPAVSRLHLHWPDRLDFRGRLSEPWLIAAHAHSILFRATVPLGDPVPCNYTHVFPDDLFVYSAFSSPPALHRLPACFVGGASTPHEDIYFKPYRRRQQRAMLDEEMGILCHGGDGEFTVVDFTDFGPGGELCLLRHRSGSQKKIETEWMVKSVRFPQGPSGHYWVTDAIVPVDGRFLCWVDNYQGILVVDVLLAGDESSPGPVQLRYIPLPDEASQSERLDPDGDCPDPARCVRATAGGMIKLVCIDACPMRRRSDFTVRSWTLYDINQGRWCKGDDMGAAEFWGLYSGQLSLPRVKPEYPLVSLVHPDATCFLLKEAHGTYWMIEVDMRNKVLKSSARYMREEKKSAPRKGPQELL